MVVTNQSDIIAELQSTTSSAEVEEEEEEESEPVEECSPEIRVCSLEEAKHHMTEIRRFFESRSNTMDSDFSNIGKLESSLLKNSCQKQSVISDFFR